MSKPHGNTGKQHAMQGSEPKTERLVVRLRPADKRRLQQEADAAGVTLTALVESRLLSG